MTDISASIEVEIQTIADYVRPLFVWVRGQDLPKQYKPDGCVVRYMSDEQVSETSAVDRIDRVYQLVIFSDTELGCLRKMDNLKQLLSNAEALQLTGSSRYMRLGSFLSSAPFLTEDKVVYAALGVLHAQVRISKQKPKSPPIGGVIIQPSFPVEKEDSGGGIVIDPGTGEDIVIGNDCRKGEV